MASDALGTRRLKALEGEWSEDELGRFFWLSAADRQAVRQCRGSANRLGFALHLLLLRLLHGPLPDVPQIPERIIQFVAMQLNLHPQSLLEYSIRRSQTRDEHLTLLRDYLGVRLYQHEADDPRLAAYLLERARQRDDPCVLLEEAEDWLREEGILLPAESSIQRLIALVRPQADAQMFAAITQQLTPRQQSLLQDLLTREEGKRGSTLAWLKEPAVQASPASIKTLIRKLHVVQDIDLQRVDLAALNRNRVRVLANLGAKYHRDALARFSAAKCQALLTCYLQEAEQEFVDRIIRSFMDLIQGMFRRTDTREVRHVVTHRRGLTHYLHTLRKMAAIVLDDEVADAEVRSHIFAVIPKKTLQAEVTQTDALLPPESGPAVTTLLTYYGFLRKFLPDVIAAIPFTGTSAAQRVVAAIASLQQMDRDGRRKLPNAVPLEFAPQPWREAIQAAEGVTAKHLWELCLAEQMRILLRSSDLAVPGSRQHKVWTAYLHPPTAWLERSVSWFARWHGPVAANAYLDHLEDRYIATLQTVQQGWESNTFASIVTDTNDIGRLAFTKDEKEVLPASVGELRDAVLRLLPHARLADVLLEVDDWVGLRHHFVHLQERQGRGGEDPRVDTALFASVLAHGVNLPLTTMAEATDIPYHELTHVSDWYLREDTIRHAIVALVDYHHRLPLSASFGPGTMAMSDGIRYEVTARSLHAQYHSRYFGTRRGVTFHDMTSDQYSHPYIQIISPHMREAHAALDALLHHETELPLQMMMVDTAGFTELMYALYDLEGFVLSPRIRDMATQRLYPLQRSVDYGVLKPLFRGPRIQRDVIVMGWDDMHRVAASLKDGMVTSVLLTEKLQALDQKNLIHRGLEEYGRILKTIDILTLVSEPSYRQQSRRILNKGESTHSLMRDLSYGQLGRLSDRDFASQLHRATCLSLLVNAIAVWNTRYMQAAIDYLRATGYPVNDADLPHLSPLLWEHINLHGSHHFDVHAPKKRKGALRPLRVMEPLF